LFYLSENFGDIFTTAPSVSGVVRKGNFGKPHTTTADPISGLLEGLVILRVEDFLPAGYRPGYPQANGEEEEATADEVYSEDRSINEILQEKYQKSTIVQVHIIFFTCPSEISHFFYAN
jgi:hypothetical protein